jgi:hypothetical protein
VTEIQQSSRVKAEGYDVTGEVMEVRAHDDGNIARVVHDGFENWYRVAQLTIDPNATPVRYRRGLPASVLQPGRDQINDRSGQDESCCKQFHHVSPLALRRRPNAQRDGFLGR